MVLGLRLLPVTVSVFDTVIKEWFIRHLGAVCLFTRTKITDTEKETVVAETSLTHPTD